MYEGNKEKIKGELVLIIKDAFRIIRNNGVIPLVSKIFHRLFRPFDKLLITIIEKATRLKDNYIVMESEGDFTDNIRAFYDFMLDNQYNRQYKLIWIVHEPQKYTAPSNVVFISRYHLINFKADYYTTVAKFFLFSHPYWFKKRRKEQIVINTTHSAAQLKSPTFQLKCVPFDYLLICSEYCGRIKQKAFSIDDDHLLEIGMPRIDILFRDNLYVKKLLPHYAGQKIILSMETFKQSNSWSDSEGFDPYAINVIENESSLKLLDDYLTSNNMVLINKIHHLQDMSYIKQVRLQSIFYLSDDYLSRLDIQSNHLLSVADVLLTDYSSVFYEFLLLDRPIGFLIGDLESYKRGFIMDDPLAEMPGHKIQTVEELILFLKEVEKNEDSFEKERKQIRDKVFKYYDCHNSERLKKWIDSRRV